MNRIRTIATAAFVGVAAVGGAFGGWAIVNAILSAPLLEQFLLAVGGLTAGTTAGYVSFKRD